MGSENHSFTPSSSIILLIEKKEIKLEMLFNLSVLVESS